MVMRIGIDTLSIIPGKIGGGEVYLTNLVENLINIDTVNYYYLFVNKDNHHLFSSSTNFTKIFCPVSKKFRPLRLFWEQFILPFQILFYKIDIFYSSSNMLPILYLPCKSVVTIHDLIWAHLENNKPSKEKILIEHLIYKSAQRADKIIAVSRKTKQDIISYFGIAEAKIIVIYESLNNNLTNHKGSPKREYSKKHEYGKFILSVGTTNFQKNYLRLLEAFAILKENQHSFNYNLVIAGMPGRAHREILNKVKSLGIDKNVIIKGYVSTKELKELYSSAQLFVFPSLCEGFGIPILEAMNFGLPVVSSNAACLPEVGGDATIYFNPFDVYDMAEKIWMVLEDDNLRSELILKGIDRVNMFSWEKAASETIDVFKYVCKNKL